MPMNPVARILVLVQLALYSDSGNMAGRFISTPVQRKQGHSVCARDSAEGVDCVKKIDI
jgi:hypothetical protein